MRKILGDILLYTLILFFIANATPAIKITGGLQSYFFAGLLMALANNLVKPILNILTIPLMFMSMGFFAFVLNALILFGITMVFPSVSVHGFNINAIDLPVALPSFYIPTILSYVALSVIIELIRRIVATLYQA